MVRLSGFFREKGHTLECKKLAERNLKTKTDVAHHPLSATPRQYLEIANDHKYLIR